MKGFINVDIAPFPGVDVVSDVSILPFADQSVDLIYSSHVFEHIHRTKTIDVLKEWHRVLKVGGIIRLAVPDFQQCVSWYLNNGDLDTIQGLVCGGHKNDNDAHRALFDHKKMKRQLESAGFFDVRSWNWRKTDHADHDDYSQSYLPHMDKEQGMLMSLNLEATRNK
jgi:predicted SAM-dependent methyltransferase